MAPSSHLEHVLAWADATALTGGSLLVESLSVRHAPGEQRIDLMRRRVGVTSDMVRLS